MVIHYGSSRKLMQVFYLYISFNFLTAVGERSYHFLQITDGEINILSDVHRAQLGGGRTRAQRQVHFTLELMVLELTSK